MYSKCTDMRCIYLNGFDPGYGVEVVPGLSQCEDRQLTAAEKKNIIAARSKRTVIALII